MLKHMIRQHYCKLIYVCMSGLCVYLSIVELQKLPVPRFSILRNIPPVPFYTYKYSYYKQLHWLLLDQFIN